MIRPAVSADAAVVAAIYNHYVLYTVATFEEQAVSVEEMRGCIIGVQERYPWLVGELDGEVVGYAYANRMHARRSYRYTVETTVYLDHSSIGKGLGRELYSALLHLLRSAGYHTAIATISLPNEPSVALHEKLGFSKAGQFHEAGWKFDRWVDVGYWQLIL